MNFENEICISDLDCIYLSYDEPQKEEFWLKIKQEIPWCKRVDGVKGSDSAHKAAAAASSTERFILIDGDNLPDKDFIDQKLILDSDLEHIQFRWKAKNYINGLCYGNGGISCWTRSHVLNMRTHENTDGDSKTQIEFCYSSNYWTMHDCYSLTYPNGSAKQAWRAGFREGVKLCTRNGMPPSNVQDFESWIWPKNKQYLEIWHTIGRDVENGFYAILGARLGTYYLFSNNWDYTAVRDFNNLDLLWEKHKNDDEKNCKELAIELNRKYGTSISEFNSEHSKFFKKYYAYNFKNINIMLREKNE